MRNFITWVKGVLQMFFQRETIKRAVGAEVAISAGMQDAITLWQRMFCNEPPWLDQNTETLGLAAAVASEIARLVTVEFHSEISGSGRRAAFLQEGYAFVFSKLREQTEFAAAMGGLVFSPAIRDASLFNGLNQLLRRIEFNCNLSYGTLSDPQNQEKTAEEIRMSKQRSYAAVCNIQKSLQTALEHLVWVMDYYTSLYQLAPDGEYEVTFNWGDGVLTDTGAEYAQMKAMVDANILKPEKLLAWYFGISEEEAKDYIPAQDTLDFGE